MTHFCYGEISASIDELKNFCGKVQAFYSFGNEVDFKAQPAARKYFHRIIRADDPAVMIFTSGTTGKLKGVLLSSYNILNAAQACDDSRENSSTKTVTCACVKIKSAAFDEKKLRNSLTARLAKFKIPEHFLVYDEFPLLGSGKIDSIALKKNAVEKLLTPKS